MRKTRYSRIDRKSRRAQTPQLRRLIVTFCQTALDDYERADCPFGETMEGLLLWFEYGQRTTRN